MNAPLVPTKFRPDNGRDLNATATPPPLRSLRHWATQPLGQILTDQGLITRRELSRALTLQKRWPAPLGQILISEGYVSDISVAKAISRQVGAEFVDLEKSPPDPRLMTVFTAAECLKLGFLPYRVQGGAYVVALSLSANTAQVSRRLPPALTNVRFVTALERQMHAALQKNCATELAKSSEMRTPAIYSCRNWSTRRARLFTAAAASLLVGGFLASPSITLGTLFAVAIAVLLINSLLKIACLAALPFGSAPKPPLRALRAGQELPKISVLVPLFKEEDIATALVKRLEKLDYPRALLEVCLIVEADDPVTRRALHKDRLPSWMRIIRVPQGTLKTKPRAMNYALNFTTGSIIGVYDAEDAPAVDQLHVVANRFAQAGPDVACLQGILSFYNGHTNWLSRCFSFEYAGWFRVMLPGLQKIGFAIPLGGTTLFFRRDVLVALGAWDSHNVTEDADLGMRLARKGYRSEMIPTITEEEANSRVWPWIRQRSRWLKGYAITWAVHMRNPLTLLKDLGVWKFIGFQILFLGTLAAFLLAPLLWWNVVAFVFGLPNPVFDGIDPLTLTLLTASFIASEGVTLSVFLTAALKLEKRPNLIWLVTLPSYFIFGTMAAYRGAMELLFRPFFWDKTAHGMFGGAQVEPGQTPQSALINRKIFSRRQF